MKIPAGGSRELLDKYNYSPNEAARGLVNQSSRIIGILIEDIRISHHTESAYIIEQEMTRLGYTCITLSTGDSPERKAECIQILTKRRVEGVILMGSMFGTEAVKQSIAEHMARVPVVIVNGSLSLPNVHCVLADEEQGVKLCTELLIRKGKRRLAFACEACTPSAANKLSGFVSAMTQAGAGEDELRIYKGCETGSADLAPEHTLLAGQELRRILRGAPGHGRESFMRWIFWPSAACASWPDGKLPSRSRFPSSESTTPCTGKSAPRRSPRWTISWCDFKPHRLPPPPGRAGGKADRQTDADRHRYHRARDHVRKI